MSTGDVDCELAAGWKQAPDYDDLMAWSPQVNSLPVSMYHRNGLVWGTSELQCVYDGFPDIDQVAELRRDPPVKH